MKNMSLGIFAVVLIVACGVVHGYWTERWAVSEELEKSAASVDRVPYEVGDWQGHDVELKGSQQEGIAKQVLRSYRNRRTGDSVTVFMVCGRPGPVCIHTPDVCYGASGYTVGNKTDVKLQYRKKDATFYSADVVKSKTVERTALRIFWAWGVHGDWTVGENPRWVFGGGRGALYKLYVIRNLSTPTELKTDPCVDFLKQFLPVLNKTLAN